jgi:aryl-alcohol dehydrogenase-like predicted oxidoreductase
VSRICLGCMSYGVPDRGAHPWSLDEGRRARCWDPATPIEESLEALHDVVKAGKARYIGASSMYAWQFSKALYTSQRHEWTRFASMQNHYNL